MKLWQEVSDSPSLGGPFRGATLPSRTRVQAGPSAGAAPLPWAPGYRLPRGVGTPGPGITALPLHHVCPQTARVLVPGWVPGGEAAREVPQACPSVGGDPSPLPSLSQQLIS